MYASPLYVLPATAHYFNTTCTITTEISGGPIEHTLKINYPLSFLPPIICAPSVPTHSCCSSNHSPKISCTNVKTTNNNLGSIIMRDLPLLPRRVFTGHIPGQRAAREAPSPSPHTLHTLTPSHPPSPSLTFAASSRYILIYVIIMSRMFVSALACSKLCAFMLYVLGICMCSHVQNVYSLTYVISVLAEQPKNCISMLASSLLPSALARSVTIYSLGLSTAQGFLYCFNDVKVFLFFPQN